MSEPEQPFEAGYRAYRDNEPTARANTLNTDTRTYDQILTDINGKTSSLETSKPVESAPAPAEPGAKNPAMSTGKKQMKSGVGAVTAGLAEMPRQALAGVVSDLPRELGQVADDFLNTGPQLLGFEGPGDPFETKMRSITPDFDPPEHFGGKAARAVAPFIAAMIPIAGELKGLGMGEKAADFAAGLGSGFLTADTQSSMVIGALGKLVKEHTGLEIPLMDYLDAPDDAPEPGIARAERRLAMAMEGAGMGLAFGAVVKGLRTFRAWNKARMAANAEKAAGAGEQALPGVTADQVSLGTTDQILAEQGDELAATVGRLEQAAAKRQRDVLGRFAAEPDVKAAGKTIQDVSTRIEDVLPSPATPEQLQSMAAATRSSLTSQQIRDELGKPIKWDDLQNEDSFYALINDVAEARRGKVTHAQTVEEAGQSGMTPIKLLGRQPGEVLNAAQTKAAQDIMAAADEHLQLLTAKASGPLRTDADLFRWRKMLTFHHAFGEQLLGARAEAGRALDAWKPWNMQVAGNAERLRWMKAMIDQEGGADVLSRQATMLNRFFEAGLPDAVQRSTVQKAWFWRSMDGFRESLMAGHLWLPTTHFANMLSPYVMAANNMLVRATAARIGQAAGREFGQITGEGLTGAGGQLGKVAIGEASAMHYGFRAAHEELWTAMVRAARDETGIYAKLKAAARAPSAVRATLPIPQRTGGMMAEADMRGKITSQLLVPEFAKPWAERSGISWAIDVAGKIVRAPYGALAVEDDFARVVAYRMQQHALAFRQASREAELEMAKPVAPALQVELTSGPTKVVTGKPGQAMDQFLEDHGAFIAPEEEIVNTKQGYMRDGVFHDTIEEAQLAGKISPEKFSARVKDLVDNPTEATRLSSANYSDYATFTDRATRDQVWVPVADAVGSLSKAPIIGPQIFTFVRTPARIMHYNAEHTPFGFAMRHVQDDIARGGADRDIALAKIAVGSLALASLFDMAVQGKITGSFRNLSPEDRETMLRQDIQPNSFEVGSGRRLSVNKVDPIIGSYLTFAADTAEVLATHDFDEQDQKGLDEVAGALISSSYNVLLSKSWMLGMARVMDSMRSGEDTVNSYIDQQIASSIPGESLLRGARDITQQVMQGKQTSPVIENKWDAVQSLIPVLEQRLSRKRDLWGNPIRMEGAYGALADKLSPMRIEDQNDDPVEAHLRYLGGGIARMRKGGQQFNGVEVDFHNFPKAFEIYEQLAGGGKEIDPEIKAEARFFGGKTTKEFLDEIVSGRSENSRAYAAMPDERKLGRLSEVVSKARRMAKVKMMDPDFLPDNPYLKEFRDYVHRQEKNQRDNMGRSIPDVHFAE